MTAAGVSFGYLAYLLQAIPGIGPSRLGTILRRIRHEGLEPSEFVALSESKLWAQYGLKADAAGLLAQPAQRTIETWRRLLELPASVLVFGEKDYPAKLAATLGETAPPVLYSLGNPEMLHGPSVGFCGSRKASDKGIDVALAAAAQLAREKIDVVSGYANGVDLAAHRGAIEAGGTTTLILAEGILHFRLKQQLRDILGEDWRQRILVLSEFSPGLPWRAHNAMTRNRTICGLADAVVVIESGMDGGTFEAGKTALALQRPLFCVEYSEPAPTAGGNAYFLAHGALSLRRGRNGEPNLSRILEIVRGTSTVAPPQVAQEGLILHEDPPAAKPQPISPASSVVSKSIPANCKRLIEVDFPIAAVSAHSAKEKFRREGHPSTLHLWWARRPLAACRAVLLGLLLPAPTDPECPANFKTRARELLSKRHHKRLTTDAELESDLLAFIGEFANWDTAANSSYVEIGRGLVGAAYPVEKPVVVDPFAGGGSIPLEALRLGCEAFASDLNPVACLILKTLLEDIPRYGDTEFKLKDDKREEIVVRGLADALRHVGKQVKEAAERELAPFYPPDLLCPPEMKGKPCVLIRVEGKQCATCGYEDMEAGLLEFQRPEPAHYWYLPASKTEVARGAAPQLFGILTSSLRKPEDILLEQGAKSVPTARPIAYLWARTVRCEGVGCGAEIPLVRSFWLSKKPERRWSLGYRIERPKDKVPQVAFEVVRPKTEQAVPNGFVAGGKATCPCCNTVLPVERVRSQLTTQRGGGDVQFDEKGERIGGAILFAVATLRKDASGRVYRLPMAHDYVAVWKAQAAANMLPDGAIPDESVNSVRPSPNARGLSAVTRYGVSTFGDLFTLRQKLTLAALGRHCANAAPEVKFALVLATSRVSERLTTLSRWDSSAKMESVAGTFSRQALQFVWDFAEQNPFADIGGNWDGAIDWIAQVAAQGGAGSPGQVMHADACASPLPQSSADVWFTDPPYYDSIPYADLSDFFFVWLKRALPNHALLNARFDPRTGLTPKTEECVWNQSHIVDGKPKDGAFFERTIAAAFAEGRRVLKADGVSCVVFAHKSTEGWEALLSGMLRAGFVITASWPLTTEMSTRAVARDTAALAGSVHLVCRPRLADAGVGDWSMVKTAMEKRVREWLPMLVKHGVRGADAIFSCLGPALESYSRYDKVLTAADREVPLGGNTDAIEPHERGFLAYVFETLSKEALRQVLGDAETEGFEEDSRMTALFLWTLQTTKVNGQKSEDGGRKTEDGRQKSEGDNEEEDETEDDTKPKKKAGFSMPFDTFIRITRPMGIHYETMEGRIIEIEKGVVRLLPVRERSEKLLGEAATRPGVEVSLEDVKQMELGLVTQRQVETMPEPKRRGRKAVAPATGSQSQTVEFTTLDRLHRAMLLFGLGRSALLRQVLETELRQGKRFERLALNLNSLYPEGSDERRMLEGVQAAMRGVR